MKNIGLITFHDTTNFGALLQTFGLYQKLNNEGYNCTIINYQCANIIRREKPKHFRPSLSLKNNLAYLLNEPGKWKKYKEMQRFCELYMPNMTNQYDRDTIKELKENFDILLVGSDMLWGLDVTDNDYTYFLDFAPNEILKISYGTSIGKEWTDKEKKTIKQYLSRFHYISVREEETADKLQKLLETKPDVVCDPTMLLEEEEWKPFISDRFKNSNYVAVYFDSDDGKALEDAKKYASSKGLDVYFCSMGWSRGGYKIQKIYSIEDYLSFLYYAKAVFTGSYHGLLFSLYFHKELFYYKRKPISRMESLAKIICVECRDSDKKEIDSLAKLDYAKVDTNICNYREYSLSKLYSALSLE